MTKLLADSAGTHAERAYKVLLNRILFLDLAPGELINEHKLCKELSFGRTPIREALKRLEGEDLVAFYPRRGTFVTHVDITELSSLYEYRAELEPIAVKLAAKNLDEETEESFRYLLGELAKVEGRTERELLELDTLVHAAIFRASGNRYIEHDLIRIDNLATRIWCVVLGKIPNIQDHVTEHVEIIETLLSRDGDHAASLVRDHVHEFEAIVRKFL